MYIFAKMCDEIITYYAVVALSNATEAEKQQATAQITEQTKYFAIQGTTVGILELILSYLGNTLFCYSAARQVSTSLM